jgi:peptide/nickel transport system permease protein
VPRQAVVVYVARRVGIGLVLVVGVTLIAFLLTHIVPGDPAQANLGQREASDPVAVAAFDRHYGLDRPLPEQYLTYLVRLAQGDFGQSQHSQRAVRTDLGEYLPATIELALFAIVISLLVGVGLGVVAALYRGRWPDMLLRVVSLIGISMPTFWTALVAFYVVFYKLGWLPAGGRLSPGLTPPRHRTGLYTVDSVISGNWVDLGSALAHLVLPGVVLAIFTIGLLLRYSRTAVLEVLGNDYVAAARAKGMPEWLVVRRHVLRPALVSIITVAGVAFGNLLSGTVLVENVFSWPGIGQYAYTSAVNLDLPAIMGVSVVIAVIYIGINLVIDLLYGVIDPRLRIGS